GPAMTLLAALGMFWSLRGEHMRMIVLIEAVSEAVAGWAPPREAQDSARIAMAIMLNFAVLTASAPPPSLDKLLRELGPGEGDTRLSAAVRVNIAYDAEHPERFADSLP